jgi:E3 ubiquitin-protein ligase MYCBP2
MEEKAKESGQSQIDFAMRNFAYYECYECKKPYFGGMRRCDMAQGDGNDDHDPKDLVCGACVAKKSGESKLFFKKTNMVECPNKEHGVDYLEHKCKFCCQIANWYCWGTTHFCDECHKYVLLILSNTIRKQVETKNLHKTPLEKLPKCEGPGKCPSGGNHNGNGHEWPLGCSLCRNSQEF